MTTLAFRSFSGVAPRLTPYRLPMHMAQVASNIDLVSRTSQPFKQPLSVSTGYTPNALSSIYRFGQDLISDTQYWFHFAGFDVDFVKGAIAQDQTERTYFSGFGAPKVTDNTLGLVGGPPYPADYYTLGVPAPTVKPNVDVTGAGTGDAEARAYVYTYVSGWGEESAPSPASDVDDVQSGQTVTISAMQTGPAGDYNVTAKRVYRSVTGSAGTLYYFVKEIPIGDVSTVDNVTTLGEPLQTEGWVPPPSNSYGMTQMANGITLLFDGYDVCPSVQYAPYAYPVGYRQSTDYKIVGGKAFGNQAVVCTVGNPYFVTGMAPDSLALQKIEFPQGCVSKRSIVAVPGGVVYASPDGLVFIGADGSARLATEGLLARKDWQALNPESIHAYLWNNRYVGFYDTGIVQGGFLFEPKEQDAAFSFIDTYATAGYADLLQDELYLKITSEIHKWNAGASAMTGTWRSGVQSLGRDENMAVARVRAVTYPVTLKLYADGVLKHTQSVADQKPFRLPGDYRARQYEVEISGANEVYEAVVASSLDELVRVQ
jgi:hypothetical protein